MKKNGFMFGVLVSLLVFSTTAFAREDAGTKESPLALFVASHDKEAPSSDRRPEFRTETAFTQTNIVSYGMQYKLSESFKSDTRVHLAAGVGDAKTRSVGVALQVTW